MAWARRDAVLFVVHAPGEPTPEDWDEFMRDARVQRDLRGLVVAVGESRPTPKQRSDIHQWFKGSGIRAAVLTDSMMARGAITAMKWFDLAVKGFPTTSEAAAFEYATLEASEFTAARNIIRELKRAMDGGRG